MRVAVMDNIFNEMQPRNCIIAHQVNAQGVMGAGVALAIRKRYPEVYEAYMDDYKKGILKLGHTSYVKIHPSQFVANICGQEYYGKNGRYTDYKALREGLEDVRCMAEALDLHVVLPYRIGCGNAGGDWENVVAPMIDEVFKGYTIVYYGW